MTFHERHHQSKPLILGNVWDVPSAITAEQLGFKALGTSSAAMAKMLGYPDGEKIPFAHIRLLTSRILEHVSVPVSVDLEAGYSRDPVIIAQHICELADLGVVGINLEDSVVTNGRHLQDPEAFAGIIAAVRANIPDTVFINVRTDTYLMDGPDKLAETKRRGQVYSVAGADGFFVPGLTAAGDIAEIAGSITLPLNVMCFPGLPNFAKLTELGIHRISMGDFLHESQQDSLSQRLAHVLADQSFKSVC
jgi:2-methylisocitrate lyase-like PEP mutase family enzyme